MCLCTHRALPMVVLPMYQVCPQGSTGVPLPVKQVAVGVRPEGHGLATRSTDTIFPVPRCPAPIPTESMTWGATPASSMWARTMHRRVHGGLDPRLLPPLSARAAAADYRRWRWQQQLVPAAVEMGVAVPGRPDGADTDGLPFPAGHEPMEQRGAPVVFLHLFQLARPATARLRVNREDGSFGQPALPLLRQRQAAPLSCLVSVH